MSYFFIESKHNGLVLDIEGGTKGANIITWQKNNGPNQLWEWREDMLISKTGYVLDIKGGCRNAGTSIIAWNQTGEANQRWKLEGDQIISKLHGFALDIKDQRHEAGVGVVLWEKNGRSNQAWKIVHTSPLSEYTTTQQESCIRCRGNGFVHNKSIGHDGPQNRKCFFCEDCPTCRGTGTCQSTTHVERNMNPYPYGSSSTDITRDVNEPCIHCSGKGFNHDSSMPHNKPQGTRCFFCEDCKTCNGSGVQKTTITEHTDMSMMGGSTFVTRDGNEPCIRCSGKGFIHDSMMKHDKPQGTKCFFCKACNTCNGSGVQKTTTTATAIQQPYPPQPYPGQSYPGQPYPGQPYPGQAYLPPGF